MKLLFTKHLKTYGNVPFILLDTEANTFTTGDLASTRQSVVLSVRVPVQTLKDLKELEEQLKNSGAEFKGRL